MKTDDVLVFDIETIPEPEPVLKALMPEIDPADVKTGNISDPAKIAEKIVLAKINAEKRFMDRAALHANTGRVAMIGHYDQGEFYTTSLNKKKSNEKDMLEAFWGSVDSYISHNGLIVGFNIFEFDLPFLIRRSWKHKVKVPPGIVVKQRFFHDAFVDLYRVWMMADRNSENGMASLDGLCAYFGLPLKKFEGKDFHLLAPGEQLDYCRQDVMNTWEIFKLMAQ